jgi:hypothetical protein
MRTSFHVSRYGMFGGHLPADLDGYCHLTVQGWIGARMDAFPPMTKERARELAREARRAVRRADRAIERWREGN